MMNPNYFQLRLEFINQSLLYLEKFNRIVNEDKEEMTLKEMQNMLIDIMDDYLLEECRTSIGRIIFGDGCSSDIIMNEIIENDWLFSIAIRCITKSLNKTEEERIKKRVNKE